MGTVGTTMKIFLDTNIIVNILSQREPFFGESYKAFSFICEQNDAPCVSASAVTDIVYILRKYITDKKQLHFIMSSLYPLHPKIPFKECFQSCNHILFYFASITTSKSRYSRKDFINISACCS